jgi:hypothetical protein
MRTERRRSAFARPAASRLAIPGGWTVYPIVPDAIALGCAVGRNVPGITIPFRFDVLGGFKIRDPRQLTHEVFNPADRLGFFHFYFPAANPVGSPDGVKTSAIAVRHCASRRALGRRSSARGPGRWRLMGDRPGDG